MFNGQQRRVAVITGASSGIGRCTALEFARRGYSLVLGARNERALKAVASDCRRFGIEASTVDCDVTRNSDVKRLADRAIRDFGGFDIWFNNAGVSAFGYFDEVPIEEHERVVETNLLGTMYGSHAAMKHFSDRKAGYLINMGSVLSAVPQPYQTSYVATKHGIRGLTAGIRQEAHLRGLDNVHVCIVMPASIDTPFFQHAANYSGRAVRAMPPVYRPEDVAKTVIGLVDSPKREIFVGTVGPVMSAQHKFAPGVFEKQMAAMANIGHLSPKKPARHTSGTLFQTSKFAAIHGGWKSDRTSQIAKAALAAGLSAAAIYGVRRRRRYAQQQPGALPTAA